MIHCYYMDLSCGCSYEQSQAFYQILPESRQTRIDKLKEPGRALKQTLSSAFLQYGLSIELEVPMEDISYELSEFGKPELLVKGKRETRIEFNLSHSGKYVVLAVSDKKVGIDVERTKKDRISVAKRCFCKEEYEDILLVKEGPDRNRCFQQYWTMKEAYVKWTGKGLVLPLNSFLIRRRENDTSYIEGKDIYLQTLDADRGYVISVCSEVYEEIKQLTMNDFQRIAPEEIGDKI